MAIRRTIRRSRGSSMRVSRSTPLSAEECTAIRQFLDDCEPEKWSGYQMVRLDRVTAYRLLATIDALRELAQAMADTGDVPGHCAFCQAVDPAPHTPDCLSERAFQFVR